MWSQLTFMNENLLNANCERKPILMTEEEIRTLIKNIKQWFYTKDKKTITRIFELKNFQDVKNFLNEIIHKVIDVQNHHPTITFGYNFLVVTSSTHEAKGVTKNDLIIAAKIDDLFIKNFVLKDENLQDEGE